MSSLGRYVNEKKKDYSEHIRSVHKGRIRMFLRIEAIAAFVFVVSAILIQSLAAYQAQKQAELAKSEAPEVHGIATEALPTTIPTNTPEPTQTPFPTSFPTSTPTPIVLSKDLYTIALFGDSMIDSMGTDLSNLNDKLIKKYPKTRFSLYNYGISSENLDAANERFEHELHYSNKNYRSIPDIKPDVIILGSYAYNPFSPYDRDRHWVALTKLIRQAQKWSKNVYILAEMAPLGKDFGKGPNGVNWSDTARLIDSKHITEQLENAISLSKDLDIPLIDVYHNSLIPGTSTGQKKYVSSGDGIHPSVEGKELIAEKILQTLSLK